eukprot:Pgem_evm1s3623
MYDLTKRGFLYSNFISTFKQETVLIFQYIRIADMPFDPQLKGFDFPVKAEDNVLYARLSGVRIVYCKRLIDSLIAYFLDFQLLQTILFYMRTGFEMLGESFTYFDISINDLLLFVPESSVDQCGLAFGVNCIGILNEYEKVEYENKGAWLDKLDVKVMGMSTHYSRYNGDQSDGFISDFNNNDD